MPETPPPQASPELPQVPDPTKRRLLKRLAWGAGGLAAASLATKLGIDYLFPPTTTKELAIAGKNLLAELSQPKNPEVKGRVTEFPDTHSSFIKTDIGYRTFFSGSLHGYTATGPSLTELGDVKEILSPSGTESFDRHYAGPSSVIRGANPNELLMFYHGENWPKAPNHSPFKAGIGLAISTDNGETWEKQGQVLKGMDDHLPAEGRPFGAGQPSAISNGEHVYLYYVDWNKTYGDSIHLARSPLTANGAPDSWEKWNGEVFTNQGMDGPSVPVLPGDEGDYAAIPGVSWNTFLNKFLMVYETRGGFNIATSDDGITWGDTQRLLDVQTANNNPQGGQVWNSYPSLWSQSQDSDTTTDENLFLVYSEGLWQSPTHTHKMKMMPIQLTLSNTTQ